jgi:hypothetical protein
MAGENSLVIQHYPDDFSLTVFPNAAAAPHDPTILLYADRDLYVDEIVVGIHAVGGSSAVLSFEVTRDLTNTAAGSVVALANIDTANVTAGDTMVLTTDGIVRTSTTGTVYSSSTGSSAISNLENKIPQGYWLLIDITGTIGSGRASVQVRYRSRPK